MKYFPSPVSIVYLDGSVADDVNTGGKVISGTGNSQEHSPSKLLQKIKGIIFDFDGTLFDNALFPFYLIAANPLDVLRIWKERLIRNRFAGSDFIYPESYFQTFFADLGKVCWRSSERMRRWYFNRYMPRMVKVLKNHYEFRPGVRELFERLDKPGAPHIAIYSDYPCIKERMEALGMQLSPKVLLYGPESFGAQKPAVRPFLRIAGDFGAAPSEVLVIGDREDTDGLGAFHAGMRFFCLQTGRKRYFRLDPNRRRGEGPPQGPSLVMYAGFWDELYKALMEQL